MNRSLLSLCALLTVFASARADDQSQRAEAAALGKRAEAVTKKIGELASSGKLPTTDESIALLRTLVDELSEIRERLKALEGDVKSVKAASKTVITGYLQFQYRDTDQPGGQPDAFQIRRARVNVNHQADPRTLIKCSADFATGANQLQAQLRDAFALYSFPGWPNQGGAQAQAGQFAIPISFQLTRGDLEREFPERTLYMNALFNGERSRGAIGRVALGNGVSAFAGGMNALSINDPEQANGAPGTNSRLAALGGINYSRAGVEAALTAFGGTRAATTNNTVAVPDADRRWITLNAGYDRARFSARGEYMTGKDRVPGSSTAPLMSGTDMRAWHLQLGYKFSPLDGLYVRYENWDRNTGTPGFVQKALGLAYQRDLTAAIRFVGAYESVEDDMLARKYGITTFRLQYRF
ncbi:MAG: hypothetical protein ACAH95_07210 [Fimbriimonas sp.]